MRAPKSRCVAGTATSISHMRRGEDYLQLKLWPATKSIVQTGRRKEFENLKSTHTVHAKGEQSCG